MNAYLLLLPLLSLFYALFWGSWWVSSVGYPNLFGTNGFVVCCSYKCMYACCCLSPWRVHLSHGVPCWSSYYTLYVTPQRPNDSDPLTCWVYHTLPPTSLSFVLA
jgi:hypothetical protein